jgi:uncharacterized RDD family membrane protein YckC
MSLPDSHPFDHAPFLRRLFAATIDLLILAIPLSVFVSFLSVEMKISTAFLNLRPGEPPSEVLKQFGGVFIYISLGFFVLISWLYFAILECSAWQATPGKHLLGLYVTDTDGNCPNFWRTTKRFTAGRLLVHIPYLGIYYFLVDCLSAAFSQRSQAIHDNISGCFVLRETISRPLRGPSVAAVSYRDPDRPVGQSRF